MRELFHVSFWLARTYARGAEPDAGLAFDANALPNAAPVPKHAIEYLQKLKTDLKERDEKLSELLAAAQPDTHDYSEAETRDYFIDLLPSRVGGCFSPTRESCRRGQSSIRSAET